MINFCHFKLKQCHLSIVFYMSRLLRRALQSINVITLLYKALWLYYAQCSFLRVATYSMANLILKPWQPSCIWDLFYNLCTRQLLQLQPTCLSFLLTIKTYENTGTSSDQSHKHQNGNRKDFNTYFLLELHFQQSEYDAIIIDTVKNAKEKLCVLAQAVIIGKRFAL